MQKNIELGKTKSGRYSKKRVNVKKALFKIVENYPNIWKSKSSGPPDEWRQIVMEVFKQTGEIVRGEWDVRGILIKISFSNVLKN